MRALVTGGAGFIGSHIVDALIRDGHAVLVIDDLSRGRREQVNPRADFTQMSVTASAFAAAVGSWHPDVIFHQAAQIDVRHSVADPLADAEANVVGTVNVLHASTMHNVKRVVFASSGGAIYGDADVIPTPETQTPEPESPYGTSKLCAEAYGGMFQRMRDLDFIALRYANVYGPRQDPHGEAGVVAIFAERLLRGETATINGDGTQTRDYVYVEDVVAANLAALDAAAPERFNIGTGIETNVNQIYQRLRTVLGCEAEAVHGPPKPGEQQRSCLSIDHARETLGWEPQTQLDEGLRRTADFFRTR